MVMKADGRSYDGICLWPPWTTAVLLPLCPMRPAARTAHGYGHASSHILRLILSFAPISRWPDGS